MGNCCKCKATPKRTITLLLVGLDNAGKTVAVKGLAGEDLNNSVPTVGFSVEQLSYKNCNVKIYDLGGSSEIRGIWHRYFVDVHGIIFVVDASDYNRFEEVKSVLEDLLSHEKISGKPLLLLANKQDNKEAFDEIDLVEKLELENLVNEKKCPTLVESCSAKEVTKGKKTDPEIEKGYRWLLNYILNDYIDLNRRVEQDIADQRVIDEKLRMEKINRLKSHNVDEIIQTDLIRPENEQPKSPDIDRPKSAVQIIKSQLQNTNRRSSFLVVPNNKTVPITLLSPKSAPVTGKSGPKDETPIHSGQILTVTGLPNAIVDANGENIGDLFELNHCTVKNRLPPLKQKAIDDFSADWARKPLSNKVSVIQNSNVDEIYKDIS